MQIPDIGVAGLSIPDIGIYMPPARRQLLMPQLPPGVSMALPVVQIPGCVAAHVDSDLQTELTTSDPSQVRIFCDAGMPMFDAMDYQPFLSLPVTKPEIPKLANNAAAPESSASAANSRKTNTGSRQSNQDQLPSSKPQCEEGEILRKGQCIKVEKPEPQEFTIGGKYLPPLGTGHNHRSNRNDRCGIISFTNARPIANWLLKLIKPTIKKIIAKIKKMLGKPVPIRSVRQRSLPSARGIKYSVKPEI